MKTRTKIKSWTKRFSSVEVYQKVKMVVWGVGGGILNAYFIASLPLNVPVKEFCKSVNIWRSYDKNLAA